MWAVGSMPQTRIPHPKPINPPKRDAAFDVQAFLDSAGAARKVVTYDPGDVVFSQGDPCGTVMYIQRGSIKLSVLSPAGKEAVVAVLGPAISLVRGRSLINPFASALPRR